MNTNKTLDVMILRSNDPRLVVAMTERELLRSALNYATSCARGRHSGAWRMMIDLYRISMARGRAGLPQRRVQALIGVFEEAEDFGGYEEFASVSAEDAVFAGFVLAAERFRSIMNQIADDYEEAVVGPSDDEGIDVDEGKNILEALIVKLGLHWNGVDEKMSAMANDIFGQQMPAESGPHLLSLIPIAQTEVMAIVRPQSAFLSFESVATMPALHSSRLAMQQSWMRELFEHLSDPEILAARRPPAAGSAPSSDPDWPMPAELPSLLKPAVAELPSVFAKKKWSPGP